MIIFPSANQVFFRAIIPGNSDSGAKLNTAYVEFVNGPPVPSVDVSMQNLRTYFDALASDADRDYLRLSVLSHTLDQKGDQPSLTLIIATDGTTGVHGKPFSASVGSRVYAVTLAASQWNDREDIFVARHHYPELEQLEKPEAGSLILSITLI